MNKKIILASASPRRKELLAQIGMEFEVRKSNAEETAVTDEAVRPSLLVKELSRVKAADVFEKMSEKEQKGCLVIGADTVVSFKGSIMGKPLNAEDAVRMLSLLQGRTHQVYTGVTLICLKTAGGEAVTDSFYEKTDVTMYPMSAEEISAYVATGDPLDKAGAYGIQGKCAAYVKGISGDYNNVVGLPVGRLYQEIKKMYEIFLKNQV